MIPRYARPELAEQFSEDAKLGRWLEVERAVLAALVDAGIAPLAALEALDSYAATGPVDVAAVAAREAVIHHDLAAFVDVVGGAVPNAAAWLHWGLTSSDVVDTALAIVLRDTGREILTRVRALREVVGRRAIKHRGTVMLGRTHGMPAEVITFGAKLAGWWHTLGRDEERIGVAVDAVSVGKLSGAVGVHTGIDARVELAALDALGLGVDTSATQVVQRDRHAQLVLAYALCASNLDRFATEVRHLQRAEVGEVAEPFARSQKGSSAMPHKRNPIVSEQVSGLARVVRSHASVVLEDVVLWHERDISHSSAERIVLPDCTLALDHVLGRMAWLVDGLVVDEERMLDNVAAQRGLTTSQRALLALTSEHGMSRDDAYRIVQDAAAVVADGGSQDFAHALVEQLDGRGIALDVTSLGVDAAEPPPGALARVDAISVSTS